MIKGKVQPQATEIEQAILGALLVDKKAIDDVGDILLPEMFFKQAHVLIYRAILNLHTSSSSVDIMTVAQHLKTNAELEKVGGDYYIVELTQAITTSAHIEFHARIVIQKFIQRQLIEISTETIKTAYNDENDVFDLLDKAYSSLNSVSEKSIKTQDALLTDLIDIQIERGEKIFAGEIKAGIPTPIRNLTSKTGGWRDSELIILAARPGMGKTAFVVGAGLKSAKMDIPTAIFSLEMSKEKLTDRILSMEAKVKSDQFNINGLDEYDMKNISEIKKSVKSLPLYIDDDASLTITQFQVKAKRLKNKYGIGLIIVDYLQLMSGDGKSGSNREQEISKISRGLKIVAKELNIPIIALSQLSRAVETRGGSKRPMLSDLRESGAIEQDADMVMFLFRPQYYGITEWDDYDHASTEGECEYIVAKNRNGGLVRNRMRFEGKYTLFSDLDNEFEDTDDDVNSKISGISTDEAFSTSNDTPF